MVIDKNFLQNYNNLFNFLYKHGGHEEVVAFWEQLTGVICGELDKLVEAKGLAGALEYWSYTLKAEEGEFFITYQVKENLEELKLQMHKCPSFKKIKDHYCRYCQHCEVLYKDIFIKRGYKYKINYTGDGKCSIIITKD